MVRKLQIFIIVILIFLYSGIGQSRILTSEQQLSNVTKIVSEVKEIWRIESAIMSLIVKAQDQQETLKRRDQLLNGQYIIRSSLRDAKLKANAIEDPYARALAYLVIAEGYAYQQPEIDRESFSFDEQGTETWYPYREADQALESALEASAYLIRHERIADISFFVHLQYDILRDNVKFVKEGHPSRDFYEKAQQAIEKAYQNQVHHKKSHRENSLTAKAYFYKMVKDRLVLNGVHSVEPPLLKVDTRRRDSISAMAAASAAKSKVPITKTKAFQFFDYLGKLFIPKYGLAKDTLALILN